MSAAAYTVAVPPKSWLSMSGPSSEPLPITMLMSKVEADTVSVPVPPSSALSMAPPWEP